MSVIGISRQPSIPHGMSVLHSSQLGSVRLQIEQKASVRNGSLEALTKPCSACKGSGNPPLASEAYPSALDPMMSVCCWHFPRSLAGRTNRRFRPCM